MLSFIILFLVFSHGYSFSNYLNNLNYLKKTYDLIDQKNNFCMLTSFNNKGKLNVDEGHVSGYILNTNGCPVIPLFDDNYEKIKNIGKYVSIIFIDTKDSVYQRRVIMKGKLKKIKSNENSFSDLPCKDTLMLKNKYLLENKNANWVESPLVNMYILNNIKSIKHITSSDDYNYVNVKNYKNFYTSYLFEK